MFRAFGHVNSCILDGGLPRWESEGFMTEGSRHVPEVKKTVYPTPSLDQATIRSKLHPFLKWPGDTVRRFNQATSKSYRTLPGTHQLLNSFSTPVREGGEFMAVVQYLKALIATIQFRRHGSGTATRPFLWAHPQLVLLPLQFVSSEQCVCRNRQDVYHYASTRVDPTSPY
jgi:hypothetical protein